MTLRVVALRQGDPPLGSQPELGCRPELIAEGGSWPCTGRLSPSGGDERLGPKGHRAGRHNSGCTNAPQKQALSLNATEDDQVAPVY